MALMPTERMDPPPGASPPMRMTTSWSGSKRTCRINRRCFRCEALAPAALHEMEPHFEIFLRFTAIPSQVGPGVRIRLAPAASLVRT